MTFVSVISMSAREEEEKSITLSEAKDTEFVLNVSVAKSAKDKAILKSKS